MYVGTLLACCVYICVLAVIDCVMQVLVTLIRRVHNNILFFFSSHVAK